MKRLVCPICGAHIDVEEALRASSAWRCLERLTQFGPAAGLVLEYCGLFRLPSRGLPWERLERLLGELGALWREGRYSHQGCVWRAERDEVVEALRQVVGSKRLTPPLQDHGYLKAVLHPKSRKEAGRREREKEERGAREAGRRRSRAELGRFFESAPEVEEAEAAPSAEADQDSLSEFPDEVREEFQRVVREQGAVAGMQYLSRLRTKTV